MYLTVQETFANLFDDTEFALLMDIGETLVDVGYTALGNEISNVILQDYNTDGMREDIRYLYNDALRSVLLQYAIKINDAMSDSTVKLFSVLKLVIAIERDENHETLLGLLEANSDPIEVLVGISEYLKMDNWVTVMEVVESVHPILLVRMKAHHEKHLGESTQEEIETPDRLTTFLSSDLAKHLKLSAIGSIGPDQVGYDVDAMLTLHQTHLVTLPAAPLAAALVYLALGSDLPSNEVNAWCQRWLERHLDDPRKIFDVIGKIHAGNLAHV